MKILFAFILLFCVRADPGSQHSNSMISSDGIQQFPKRFPKIIWTYWDNGIQNAKLFTQLCVQNMKRTAQKAGWQLRVLNNNTFIKYIGDITRFRDIITNAKVEIGLQKKADIIRLMLLYAHGGVWADTNLFFTQDLDWIQHIEKQTIIDNKFGQYPQALMFSFQNVQGDLRIQLKEGTQNQKVLICPQNEIWFMATFPKTELFRDWLNEFQLYIKGGFDYVQKKNKQEGTRIGSFHYWYGNDYLFANRALQSVLQLKQKQIDKQIANGNNTYLFAVNYYKIWTIESRDSGYYLQNRANRLPIIVLQYLTQYTQEQLKESIGLGRYFVKLNLPFYNPINNIIEPDLSGNPFFQMSDYLIVLNNFNANTCHSQLSVQHQSDFKMDLPKQFVVAGSILQKYLLRQSALANVKYISIFNKEQINQKCRTDYWSYVRPIAFFLPLLVFVIFMVLTVFRVAYLCLIYLFIKKKIERRDYLNEESWRLCSD